jgi:alpha-ribazole phosphatase
VIWLVRHAQPLVDGGVCYGALDLAADAQSTQRAAKVLAEALPEGVLVKTSPLQRCEHFAQCLSGLRPDLSYGVDGRLREMNFGLWEGVRWASIPSEALNAWTDSFWAHRFGGVDSVADVMARVASAWDEAAQSDQAQVWITHAGVIRAASLIAQGIRKINDASLWPVKAPGYGEWFCLG